MKIQYIAFLLILLSGCGGGNSEISTAVIMGQKFDNPQAEKLNDLAIAKAQNGQLDSAMIVFFEALKLEPNNPALLSNIGLTYETLNDNDQAVEFYNKSLLRSDSTYLIAGVNLGRMYCQMSDYSEGIAILDFVINNCKEDELLQSAYINRALNHLGNKDCKQARSDFTFFKESNIRSEELEHQMGKLESRIEECR